MFVLLVVIQTILHWGAAVSVAPTWVTSSLVKAGQFNVINNVLSGRSATPAATMTFSSAFSALPNLGYGIINYEGIT